MVREGAYLGVTAPWLRWATLDGVLLPTPEEVAAVERQRAEEERRRAEQAEQRLAEMEAQLARYRERFGVPPDERG